MSLCHVDHYPYSCDDDALHHVHHHHHYPHHNWCNAWFHNSCLTGQVSITKEDGFELQIDVRHFKYDELKVKTIGDWIIVEGKQSNEKDLPVCITRHFSRKYKLPRYYDSNLISSNLSSDGILIVKVPPPVKEPDNEEKIIHIEKSGPYFKSGNKTNDNNNKNNNNEKENNNKSPTKKGAATTAGDQKPSSNIPNENPGPSTSNVGGDGGDGTSGVKIEELNSNDDKMNNDNDKI
ncbi:heat shock protein 23-like [Condylostylus longicornis]|uniref:heat shock protein 23-like n=1 Tax=Condylostylus longicornis TaxID=2530218 RepID=UPI00244DD334|nr:heat shock protein 23-like [Condylostylus longicornis]